MPNNIGVPHDSGGRLVATQEVVDGAEAVHLQFGLINGSITGKDPFTKGRKTAANSFPVVLASDALDASDNWTASQFTLTTASQQILSANPNRRAVVIQNLSTGIGWFRHDTAATNNSYRLPPVDGAEIELRNKGAIHGRCTTGTMLICIMEESN